MLAFIVSSLFYCLNFVHWIRLFKEWFQWAIASEVGKPGFAGIGLYPVAFLARRCLGTEIEVNRSIFIHLKSFSVAVDDTAKVFVGHDGLRSVDIQGNKNTLKDGLSLIGATGPCNRLRAGLNALKCILVVLRDYTVQLNIGATFKLKAASKKVWQSRSFRNY